MRRRSDQSARRGGAPETDRYGCIGADRVPAADSARKVHRAGRHGARRRVACAGAPIRARVAGALLRRIVTDASALTEYLLRTPRGRSIEQAVTAPDAELHAPALRSERASRGRS